MVYINARCREILSMLLKGKDYIPLKQIAQEVGVSKRSIYYDICKLNEWLAYYGVKELEIVRGKGILIPEEEAEKIKRIAEGSHEEEKYIFSPTERIQVIYCYILISHLSENVYIEQLSEYCGVSRNTIFNDLRILVNELKDYNLTLEYETKRGYKIGGDVVSIRAMFFMYFNNLLPLLDSGVLDFIYKEPIKEHLEKLEKIAEELDTEYVNGVLLSLAALVPLMYKGRRRPYFPNLKKDNVVATEEYRLVGKYFPDLDETEHIYLVIHLLGSRVSVLQSDMFDSYAEQSVYEITKSLVAEFEKRACVFFENKEELERALFSHINTSLYRYRYGVQIGNQMTKDIIREYPNLFEITRHVSKYLEQLVGLPIPDSEVAYLALHFGSYLKVSQEEKGELRILIICVNGISTGNMLKREVQNLLPEAKIVGVAAAMDMFKAQKVCDLVISTVKVESLVPVIQVHPILTDYDRRLILKYRKKNIEKQKNRNECIFDTVKKYVAPENYEALRRDLEACMQEESGGEKIYKEQAGLLGRLKKNRVQILEGHFQWQEAVRCAGKSLVEAGSIEKRYLEKIISQILYYGPFMFLNQGLVLAHAKPEDGVNYMDVALTVFKEPVAFSEYHYAKIIITLAVEDQERHLGILKDIMAVFGEERHTEELALLASSEEILKYMQQYIHERKE
ncbi:BglG family transcription antiterminator [Acetivibrio ethanolgignens]|uniref:Transcriptional antiterminator n=1 Tax=Acetivibrio ethanolgignens TaxID=290052 RepID=A0A0V8QCQ4_9FIRM|nr:PRD domain-containing protein [Acetivibrio ethanolgignens]KSV58308.1 transcriptional antiterminator [Acetivibrio ethanolgignens]